MQYILKKTPSKTPYNNATAAINPPNNAPQATLLSAAAAPTCCCARLLVCAAANTGVVIPVLFAVPLPKLMPALGPGTRVTKLVGETVKVFVLAGIVMV